MNWSMRTLILAALAVSVIPVYSMEQNGLPDSERKYAAASQQDLKANANLGLSDADNSMFSSEAAISHSNTGYMANRFAEKPPRKPANNFIPNGMPEPEKKRRMSESAVDAIFAEAGAANDASGNNSMSSANKRVDDVMGRHAWNPSATNGASTAQPRFQDNRALEGSADTPFINSIQDQVARETHLREILNNGLNGGQSNRPAEPSHTPPLAPEVAKYMLESYAPVGRTVSLLKIWPWGSPRRPQKMLLIGAPGTGKTTLAQAIAQECGAEFELYKATDIANSWKSSGNANMREIFKRCAASGKPCVIAIDEFQVLINQHNDPRDFDRHMLTNLWLLIDEYKMSKILFIGMMNYVDDVPGQIKDRFGSYIFRLSVPGEVQRAHAIQFHFNRMENTIWSNISYSALAKQTEGFSNRNLENLVIDAANIALIRASTAFGENFPVQSMQVVVTMQDFQEALQAFKSAGTRYDELGDASLKQRALHGTKEFARWVAPRLAEAVVQSTGHAAAGAVITYAANKWNGIDPNRDRQESMRMSQEALDLQRNSEAYQKIGAQLAMSSSGNRQHVDLKKAMELGLFIPPKPPAAKK